MESNIAKSTYKLCTVILYVCIALQVKSLKGQKVHENNEICRMPFILNLNRKLLVIIETSHQSLTTFRLENMIKKIIISQTTL